MTADSPHAKARAPLHLRALDRRQPRPRPVRQPRPASRSIPSTRSAGWPSSAPGASACTTRTSSRTARRRPSATASSPASPRRSSRTGWASAWRRATCSASPRSRTARSPRTTAACAAPRSARRCGRSTSARSWAPRCSSSGAGARAPRRASRRTRATRWSATARRSTCCATTPSAQGYDLRFAIEPKPNEPRGDIFLPTIGHALHFISHARASRAGRRQPGGRARDDGRAVVPARDRPGAVGGQAVPRRPQRAAHRPLRPGLPLRRRGPQGGVPARPAARARRLQRARGTSTPSRTAARTPTGVWDFARGCMRTYLALAERAREFDALPAVQEALAAASTPELGEASTTAGAAEADTLKAEADGLEELARRGYANEALDQLLVEVLLGLRQALELGDQGGILEHASQRRRGGAAHGGLAAQLGAEHDRGVPLATRARGRPAPPRARARARAPAWRSSRRSRCR